MEDFKSDDKTWNERYPPHSLTPAYAQDLNLKLDAMRLEQNRHCHEVIAQLTKIFDKLNQRGEQNV